MSMYQIMFIMSKCAVRATLSLLPSPAHSGLIHPQNIHRRQQNNKSSIDLGLTRSSTSIAARSNTYCGTLNNNEPANFVLFGINEEYPH